LTFGSLNRAWLADAPLLWPGESSAAAVPAATATTADAAKAEAVNRAALRRLELMIVPSDR
jgi:hypothetical protein